MTVATEQEAVRLILDQVKTQTLNLADHLRSSPDLAGHRDQVERIIELRFSLMAIIEAAIDNGLMPADAFGTFRDLGVTTWGTKISVQYAGRADPKAVRLATQDMAGLLSDAAGIDPAEPISVGSGAFASFPSTARH